VSGSGISWAICKSAPCSRQITMPAPHPSVFYRPDALPATQPTVSKHWRLNIGTGKQNCTITQGLSDSKPWWLFPNPFWGLDALKPGFQVPFCNVEELKACRQCIRHVQVRLNASIDQYYDAAPHYAEERWTFDLSPLTSYHSISSSVDSVGPNEIHILYSVIMMKMHL